VEFKPAGVSDAVPGTVQYTLLLVLSVLLPRTLHRSHAVKISQRCKSACVQRRARSNTEEVQQPLPRARTRCAPARSGLRAAWIASC